MAFSFLSNEFNQAVQNFENYYLNIKNDNNLDEWSKKLLDNLGIANILDLTLRQEFEKQCTLTKQYEGFDLTPIFDQKIKMDIREKLERLNLLMYVYYKESYFRRGITNPGILKPFFIFIENNKSNFKNNLSYFFTFVAEIPFYIMSEIYSNENFQKIIELSNANQFDKKLNSLQNIDKVLTKIDDWDASFHIKQTAVNGLEARLEASKQTYDFVLLNQGFKNLHDQKKLDLKKPIISSRWFLGSILAVPIIEIIVFGVLLFLDKTIDPITVWYVLIPSISLILFLFYFYKINLQEARSIKSQMMQLELRMALCQFIHNYADDSEKLHKKNAAGFEKFENIIFSPLVSSDDKIPTTFDGMEQLAKMVDVFRKN